MDQLVQSDLAMDARPVVGIWLSDEPVQGSVESLLLEMLAPNFPNPVLRGAAVEELGRGVKLAGVAVESLELRTVSIEENAEVSLRVVAPKLTRDLWREALVAPGGDRPIGLLIHAAPTACSGTAAVPSSALPVDWADAVSEPSAP